MVTGAGSGLGREVALHWGRHGFGLILLGRNEERLQSLALELQDLNAESKYAVCDVRDSAQVRAAMEKCGAWAGRLDVLFNNAGVGQFLPLSGTTDEIWCETIETNLTGAFNCTREALPLFESAGGGLIINNASVAAKRGFPQFAAYCASKAGLLGFSNSIREELRAQNIRVSVVLPGATDTPFWDHVEGEWSRSKMVPLEHVARIIANIALEPPELQLEEITIMPAGGAL